MNVFDIDDFDQEEFKRRGGVIAYLWGYPYMELCNDPSAYPVGTRVEKVHSAGNDIHKDGAQGTVISRWQGEGMMGYFVTWEDCPSQPCFIAGPRVRKL